MATTSRAIEPKTPFTAAIERHYQRLLDDMQSKGFALNVKSARSLWRIRHCVPILSTGRASDLLDRLYSIPSTRKAGEAYRVNLETGVCDCRGFSMYRHCSHISDASIFEHLEYGEQLKELQSRQVQKTPLADARRVAGDISPSR